MIPEFQEFKKSGKAAFTNLPGKRVSKEHK